MEKERKKGYNRTRVAGGYFSKSRIEFMADKTKTQKEYIFLDESGKPEVYSKKGVNLVDKKLASKYLVITAVRTPDHLSLQKEVTAVRLKILRNKKISSKFSTTYSLDSFHAQTDYPEVKELFYKWIKNCRLDFKIAVIVADKLKAYSALQQNPAQLYAVASGELLKRFLHTSKDIEVVFSRRDATLKAKQNLQLIINSARLNYTSKYKLDSEVNIVYHHNPHYSHGGLQIADYVAHAVFQVFENNKRQYYDIIMSRIGYIQDIFNKKSYSRSNPL